jgi:hypothetical protein
VDAQAGVAPRDAASGGVEVRTNAASALTERRFTVANKRRLIYRLIIFLFFGVFPGAAVAPRARVLRARPRTRRRA